MALTWLNSLAVGVPDIDKQHQELFAKANTLFDAMRAGESKEAIGPLMGFLGDYVVQHFQSEERHMRLTGYPAYPVHKAQHDAFVTKFKEFAKDLETNGPHPVLAIRVQRTVSEWLLNHIAKVDTQLAAHLNSKAA